MMRSVLTLTLFSTVLFSSTVMHSADPRPPPLQCNIGPITKTFGGAPWLVYSCADDRSLVIVAAPGSPATPFIFSFMLQGGTVHFNGEGTGRKDITDAAFKELKALSLSDIADLVRQTKAR